MKYTLLIFSLFLMACPNQGPDVKIYSSQPDKGGAVRAQALEIVPYANTKNWLMLTPDDAEALLNYCLNPTSDSKISTTIHHEMEQQLSLLTK